MESRNSFKLALEGAQFSFTVRPDPVAGDLRMSWGIGILLLSLLYSRGKKCSFQKLQLLAHSVRTGNGRDGLIAVLRKEQRSSEISVRVEPWLNRAVSFAHALGLVDVGKGKSVVLTDKGRQIASEIEMRSDVFVFERDFLARASRGLTEVQVTQIWRMEDLV